MVKKQLDGRGGKADEGKADEGKSRRGKEQTRRKKRGKTAAPFFIAGLKPGFVSRGGRLRRSSPSTRRS